MPGEMVFALSSSFTMFLGLVSFFVVYSAARKAEDDVLREFSRRFLILIIVMVVFAGYWTYYRMYLTSVGFARYPLFLAVILVFLYLAWNSYTLRKVSMDKEKKLEKVRKGENV